MNIKITDKNTATAKSARLKLSAPYLPAIHLLSQSIVLSSPIFLWRARAFYSDFILAGRF